MMFPGSKDHHWHEHGASTETIADDSAVEKFSLPINWQLFVSVVRCCPNLILSGACILSASRNTMDSDI